MTKACAIFIEK